jgi:hypothetical protein
LKLNIARKYLICHNISKHYIKVNEVYYGL